MKKLLTPSLLLVMAVMLCVSCRTIREPEFQYIENLQVENIGLNSSTLSVQLRYRNPNHTRLKLKQAEGDAWLNNNFLGHFRLDSTVDIPADDEFSLPVTLKLEMDQVIQNSISLLNNKEVPVKLEGRAKFGKGGVYINYPIHYEGMQKVRRLVR
jgi:LEA14-like dessication related protein